jgi:hypothetical protein
LIAQARQAQRVFVYEVFGLNLQEVSLLVEKDFRLARDAGIVARELGRHGRRKRFGARECVRRLDFGLFHFFAEYSAKQAFRHVFLPWLGDDVP